MKRFALKRITALVLALIMTLSLLPMAVWAETTEYTPLFWSNDGGETYNNSIDMPIEQKPNNNGYMLDLYINNGETYSAIDKTVFTNATITELNDDIGFVGWTTNGDGMELLLWNTENVAGGTESGIVFNIGEIKYLVNLKVIADPSEDDADLPTDTPATNAPWLHSVSVLTSAGESHLGYFVPTDWDGVYLDSNNVFQIPCPPIQDKMLYLATDSMNVTLAPDGTWEYASLKRSEKYSTALSTNVYELVVDGQDSGSRLLKVKATESTEGGAVTENTLSFQFNFEGYHFTGLYCFTKVDDEGHLTYYDRSSCDGLGFIRSVNGTEERFSLRVPFVSGQGKALYLRPARGEITSMSLTGGNLAEGGVLDTTRATFTAPVNGTDYYTLTLTDAVTENCSAYIKLSNGIGVDIQFVVESDGGGNGGKPFTLNGLEVYTTKDNGVGQYFNWSNYDGLGITKAGPPESQFDAVRVPYTPGQEKKLFLKLVDSNITLTSIGDGCLFKDFATLGAIEESTGIYELTLANTATGGGNVWVGFSNNSGVDFIFEPQTGGSDNMDKFYTTSRGNSVIRVRLSNEQAKVVSLPDKLNEKDELIVTVHNVDNKEVWRPLLDDNMNLAVCYEFDELNVAENPSTATLPDVFHMSRFDYGNLEEFIDLLERDVANGATFDTYNQFGSTRQNGNFFAWASSNPGDITILPTDRDDTYGWVFRHKNADGSYSYAYDGFVMKFVLEEGADEPIVLEEIKYPAVAADRVAFVPNYASAHVNLEKVLSISEYKNNAFTYTEDGVLNYVYKGSETTFQAIQDDVLSAAALDGFKPDQWGVLYYDLLSVTAPTGYTAKELWCSYYKQSFGGDTMTLRYHWRGASTDLDFLLTWVDDQGNELVEKITIRMPKVEGGEKWMDLVATPVEVGRVEFTQPGADSGALNSYTTNNLGVMWTQYDNDEMVDVDAVLASTVRFLAPTIDGKTATHYQLCYYGDGSDDPTLNLNNEWLADRIGFDSSYMEVVDGGTHPERIRGLLKQTYGEYDEIVYYYSADRHTRGYFVRWHFGDGVEPVTEYIQLDTSSYFCQWKSEFGETDASMPSVSLKDGTASSDYAFLLTRIHPQKESGKYFFELSVVDKEGNTSVIDEGDTFRIILPYSFMGVDTNGEAWTYEKVRAAEMKDPIINHYDDTYKKLQGNKGAVKGTFTEKGIEFVVDSFSPFMLTWNDPNAPKAEAQLYIGYENQNGFEWQDRANCPLGRTSNFKLGFKTNDNYVAFTADELASYEIKCSVGNITYDESGVATWNIGGVANSTFGTLEVITGSTVYRAQMVVSPGYEPMFLVDERGAHSGTWADGGQTHTFKLYADMSGTVTITPKNYEFTATNAAFSVSENGDAVDVTLPFATRGEEYGYLIAVEKNSTGETTKKYQFEITAFNDPFRLAGAEIYTTMSEVDGGILLGYNDWRSFDGLRAMENGGGGTSVVVPFESGEGKTVYMVVPNGMTPNPSPSGSVIPTITPVTGVANLYKVTLGTDVTYSGGVWIEFVDDEGNNREGLDMIFDCGDGGGNGPMGSYGVEIFTSYHDEYGICYDRPDWGGVCGGDGFFTVSSTPGEADVLYLISESELRQPSDINTADGDGWEELTGVLNADDSRHAYKMTIKAQNGGAREVNVPVNDKKLTFTFRFDAFCYLGGEFYTKMTGNAEDGYTLGYVKAPAEFDYLHVYYDEQDNNMMLRLPYEPGAEATVYVKAPSVITDMKIEGGGLENIATISKVATFDGYNCFAITLPEGSNENGGVVFVQSYVSDGKAGNFLLCFMPNGGGGDDGNRPPYPIYEPPLLICGDDGWLMDKANINAGSTKNIYLHLPTQSGPVKINDLSAVTIKTEPVSEALENSANVGTFTVSTDKTHLIWNATNASANQQAWLCVTVKDETSEETFKVLVHTNAPAGEKTDFKFDQGTPGSVLHNAGITIGNKTYYLIPVQSGNGSVVRGAPHTFEISDASVSLWAYTAGLATTTDRINFELVTDKALLEKLENVQISIKAVDQESMGSTYYEGGSQPFCLNEMVIRNWDLNGIADQLKVYNASCNPVAFLFDKSSTGVWELTVSAEVDGVTYTSRIYKEAIYKSNIYVAPDEDAEDVIGNINEQIQRLKASIAENLEMDLSNTKIVIEVPAGEHTGYIEVPGVVGNNAAGNPVWFPDVIICGSYENGETVIHGGVCANNNITTVDNIRFIGAGKDAETWAEVWDGSKAPNYGFYGSATGGYTACSFSDYYYAMKSTNGTRFGGDTSIFYNNHIALGIDIDPENCNGGNPDMSWVVFAHNDVALELKKFAPNFDQGLLTTYQNIFYNNKKDVDASSLSRSFFMPSNVYDNTTNVPCNFTGHVYGDPYYLLSETGRAALSITEIGKLSLGTYDENWIQQTESGEFIKVFPTNWKVPMIYANADDYVIPANELKKGLMTIDMVDNREDGTNGVVATMKMKPAAMRLMGLRSAVVEEVFDPLLEIYFSEDGDKIFITMDAVPSGVEAELTIPCTGWSDVTVTDEEGYKVAGATFADGAATFSAVGGTYIIYKKSVPTVTAPKANELTYTGEEQALVTEGTTSGGTLKYSLNGETYSTDIPTGKDAKTYTVWYKVEGDNYNSNVEAVSVEVTIAKADATVTAPVAKTDLKYTGAAQALITAGSTADGTLQYSLDNVNYSTSVPTGKDAKTYTVYYKVVGDANHNDVETQSITVTISKAAVTVTAGNKSKVYGESDPALTYSASGLVGEEKLSDISVTRVSGETVGEYVITATQTDGANSNYEIIFVNGTFTITAKTSVPTIELSAETFTYDGTAKNPTVTVKDGENVIPTSEYTVVYSDNINAGAAKVTIADVAGGNYVVNGSKSFTIAKAPLTVTANAKTITYGAAPANAGVEYKGFVNGETEAALTGTLSYSYDYEQYGDVGTYTITPAGLSSNNYEITFVNGTLTVEQKEIGIEWGNTDLTYSGEAQAPTATATGAVNGDVLTLTVTGAQMNASADAYTATVTAITGEKSENYSLPSVATAEFTIAKATQAAPVVVGVNETVFAKNDGKITDVTNAMEYSVDGVNYNAITDGKLENLAPATYYVRYAETENRLASDVVTVVIAAGKKVTVTFAVNGGNAIETIKDLAYGDKVTAPTEPEKAGYTFGGWFSDEACTKAWDFDKDAVSADVTLYAKWNAIPVVYPPYVPETPSTTPVEKPTETKPTTPAQPVAPPAEVTVPVSGDENTINVEASVSGSTASIDKVDMTKLEGVIGDDVAVGTVTIDFSDLESSETIDTVEIPSEVVKEIAEAVADPNNDAESLEIVLSDGASIEFDAAALAEKASQAGGVDITISIKQAVENVLSAEQQAAVGDRVAFDINVTSGGVHISDMGGKITIHAPYELRDGETAEGIVVYYVDDAGNKEKCETSYDSVKKRVNWKTDHLSVYMIAHEAPVTDDAPAVDNTPADDMTPSDSGNSVGLWIGVALAVLVVAIIVVVILIKRKKA